jgi:hypothetical protein
MDRERKKRDGQREEERTGIDTTFQVTSVQSNQASHRIERDTGLKESR